MEFIENLNQLLTESVKSSTKDLKEVAIAFSGGLDSTIIAHLVSKSLNKESITLYVVGTRDCHDVKLAEETSKYLNLNLKKIIIDENDIRNNLPELIDIISIDDKVTISYLFTLYFVAKNATEKAIISGQGADTLFGGFFKYMHMEGAKLMEEIAKDTDNLLKYDINLHRSIASFFGKDLRCPFLDEKIISYASTIPVELKVNKGERKLILREVANYIGLPAAICNLPKKSAQYGSGIMKIINHMSFISGGH